DDQHRQIAENNGRLPAIDHEVEKAERLRHPDDQCEDQRKKQERPDDLTQEVEKQLPHASLVPEFAAPRTRKNVRLAWHLLSHGPISRKIFGASHSWTFLSARRQLSPGARGWSEFTRVAPSQTGPGRPTTPLAER